MLPLTIGSFFGAMDVWGWPWFGAAAFAAPGLLFILPVMVTTAAASLFGGLKTEVPLSEPVRRGFQLSGSPALGAATDPKDTRNLHDVGREPFRGGGASNESDTTKPLNAPKQLTGAAKNEDQELKNSSEEFPKAATYIEYDPETAEIYKNLAADLPASYVTRFLQALEAGTDVDSSAIAKDLRAEHLQWLKPYENTALNDALEELRQFNDEAAEEFKRVVGVLGEEKSDPSHILEKIKATYEEKNRMPTDAIREKFGNRVSEVTDAKEALRLMGFTVITRGGQDSGGVYEYIVEEIEDAKPLLGYQLVALANKKLREAD